MKWPKSFRKTFPFNDQKIDSNRFEFDDCRRVESLTKLSTDLKDTWKLCCESKTFGCWLRQSSALNSIKQKKKQRKTVFRKLFRLIINHLIKDRPNFIECNESDSDCFTTANGNCCSFWRIRYWALALCANAEWHKKKKKEKRIVELPFYPAYGIWFNRVALAESWF